MLLLGFTKVFSRNVYQRERKNCRDGSKGWKSSGASIEHLSGDTGMLMVLAPMMRLALVNDACS